MKATIIKNDAFVSVDGVAFFGLPLFGIPEDVHAVQWHGDSGWIEYVDAIKPNEKITSLNDWMLAALKAHDDKKNEPPPLLPTKEENEELLKTMLIHSEFVDSDEIKNPSPESWVLRNIDELIAFRNEVKDLLKNVHAGPMQVPVMPETSWLKPDGSIYP